MRANLAAWHSDQKAAVGQGFAIYPEHNLHMLLYAASYDGQGAIAMRAGKDYTKLTGESFYEVLTLIRFGRFDEVLEVTNRPKAEIQGGLWDFAQGYAHLKQGNADFAQALSRARHEGRRDVDGRIPRPHGEGSARHRRPASSTERFSGWPATSTAPLPRSSAPPIIQAALVYDEPEPLPFSAFHWLGAALLEGKRFDEAEKAYRDRAEGPPAQRLVAARPAAGTRGQGHRVARGGRRPRGELVARRHLDPVVALLNALRKPRRVCVRPCTSLS